MKTNIKQTIEIIGFAAVVVSLIFVGIQLRLDSRVALADQYAFRSESVKNDLRSRIESEDFLEMEVKRWENGSRPPWWTEEIAS